MQDREKMLASLKMIEMGIAPFARPSFFSEGENEIARALESLSPDDRRKAKRKFRKLYKKAYKKLGINFDASKKPSAFELRRRQAAVYRMILSDIVS